jgi:MtN3 and saliva related transmembrane protein
MMGSMATRALCKPRTSPTAARHCHIVSPRAIDVIGWASSAILLATIGRQVYTQWKTHATRGVSKWLFVGQVVASVGFSVYSYFLHNWVFFCSNIALLVTAVVGEWLYARNRRHEQHGATT